MDIGIQSVLQYLIDHVDIFVDLYLRSKLVASTQLYKRTQIVMESIEHTVITNSACYELTFAHTILKIHSRVALTGI